MGGSSTSTRYCCVFSEFDATSKAKFPEFLVALRAGGRYVICGTGFQPVDAIWFRFQTDGSAARGRGPLHWFTGFGYTGGMQIVSQGIDIVECRRIERIWRDHAGSFLDRIYTPAEQEYCVNCKTPAVRLAGRFAAKEAVLKALGTGWRGGIEFRDIETLPDPLGKPLVTLHRKTADLARTLGIDHVLVSISHAGQYAVASAIAVGDGKS